MRDRISGSMVAVTIAAAALGAAISVPVTQTSAQAPAASGMALKTPWGEPDLQGIWTDEFDTPFQRPAKYANQEFFTEAQREELDKQRGALYGSDPRQQRGTALDVGGAYNTAFLTVKHAGLRTSLVVDPPDGRVPPQTPEAQNAAAADREFRLALLRSTEACKNRGAGVCRRQVRSDALASIRGTSSSLPRGQLRALESQRWSGGRRVGRSLSAQRVARVRKLVRRELSPYRADTRRHLDVLRREPRPRVAAKHRHERESSLAGRHPSVVRRLARPLGGQTRLWST